MQCCLLVLVSNRFCAMVGDNAKKLSLEIPQIIIVMEQMTLESIRKAALDGLKLENDMHKENIIKRVLEIIVMSYKTVLLPHSEEVTIEDENVRFLINELSYYMDNL